jgi:hypothetical protein
MLQPDDFNRDNWESVTWRIVSGTYVRGYMLSDCLPPQAYFEWVMDRMGLSGAGAIRIENAVGATGSPHWKLTFRQVDAEGVRKD